MYWYGYANKEKRERERDLRVNSWDTVGALVDVEGVCERSRVRCDKREQAEEHPRKCGKLKLQRPELKRVFVV